VPDPEKPCTLPMKIVLLILDGGADEPLAELEAAHTPRPHPLARRGGGGVRPVEDVDEVASYSALVNLLGCPPMEHPRGAENGGCTSLRACA
jgi:2,3-bisphosphoglycerate-independent phosphoglycerate mutase